MWSRGEPAIVQVFHSLNSIRWHNFLASCRCTPDPAFGILRARVSGISFSKAESITMQTLFSQPPARVATIAKVDFRRVLNRVKFTPQAIKCGVVLLFTVLWLVVALVRSTAPRDAESLETSSLMALARLLQENFISGRDFQSVFGPGMQFLVAIATSLTNAPTPLDTHAMIAFFLAAGTAILIGITLLLCDQFSWQESAIAYGLCFFLNLFFGALDFRIALLLLSAVLAYRIAAAENLNKHMLWAAATAVVCFFSQLVSFELGIYEVLVVVPALILTCVLIRDRKS